MGAKQFSNALLVQHLQNYDLLHLQYLQTLALLAEYGSLLLMGPSALKFKPFYLSTTSLLMGFRGLFRAPSGFVMSTTQ
jgi:hypothetical protein